ncbi:Chondroadherin [Trachymyrmex septentrionalis]|uniref:Chondroadherin n=1 Tax=Trachymyrmex septentrionalis TaxID=34720 RepID=A0A195FFI0_9HYME|nr:Chondroadherin [Trachymyrmex septentrionalis]
MDRTITLVLFALLTAFVGDVTASCRKVENEDMLEYVCEGGHPVDLSTVPETTEKLRIFRMPLHRITADTFSRFGGNLWVLSCSHCEITDIDADAFRRLVNLQQLSLDNNRLTTVRSSWFEGLDSLTYLDLNYNNIRDIEDGVYTNLPSLVDLRISGNRLQCLNLDEMSYLKELKRIFLSENSDFACPHAVSKFLENQGVAFEQDPEWRRLTSDIINVHVPPIHVEEGEEIDSAEIVPMHRERLHPSRRPPPEESEESYRTRDKTFYPNHSETYRSRHRRPPTTTVRTTPKQQEELPLPRVESRFPDTRPSHIPSESSSHQVMSHPYSTPETPPAPPAEDIKMPGTDEPSRTEHTLMYPQQTHETTPYWLYPTPERPRVPPVTLSEDIRIVGTDRPPRTEGTSTYPAYIPPHETIPSYPLYPTSERSQVFVMGSSEDKAIGESGRSSQAGNTMTYPLYVATSNGLESMPRGSIQMTSGVSDMIWSTDDSVEHPVYPMMEHHEQSRRPTEGSDRVTSTKTPYYGHDPRKMIVEEPSSETDDDFFISTVRPIEYDRSRTTTKSDMHYVRPSPPELINSPSTDEMYQVPYYEPTVTIHPPQNYQDNNGEPTGVRPIDTTQEPLPKCENSAPKIQSAALVTFVVVTVFGHAVTLHRIINQTQITSNRVIKTDETFFGIENFPCNDSFGVVSHKRVKYMLKGITIRSQVRTTASWAKEAAEAERLEKMLKIENEENAATNDLALVIQNRNKARANQAESFFDSLIDKYAKKAEKPSRSKASPSKKIKKKT